MSMVFQILWSKYANWNSMRPLSIVSQVCTRCINIIIKNLKCYRISILAKLINSTTSTDFSILVSFSVRVCIRHLVSKFNWSRSPSCEHDPSCCLLTSRQCPKSGVVLVVYLRPELPSLLRWNSEEPFFAARLFKLSRLNVTTRLYSGQQGREDISCLGQKCRPDAFV